MLLCYLFAYPLTVVPRNNVIFGSLLSRKPQRYFNQTNVSIMLFHFQEFNK